MKRRIAVAATFVVLVASSGHAFGAVKIGSSCSKVSLFQQSGKTLLVCDLIKKKKVWRKASTIETTLYKNEQLRIQREAEAKAAADKAAADKAAADKAAADKAAADKAAADKAAADKAAADKAAADKAAADKAAADKAAADKAAADKAAADAAAKAAAEVPSLVVGSFYSGIDADYADWGWRWIAVRLTNSASSKIYSHHSFDVLMGDSGGGIVDSNFEANFPLIAPKQTIWYVTTQFKGTPASQIVFQKRYSTTPSPLAISELPTTSNARLISSPYLPNRKSVAVTVRNNSTQILSKSSSAYAVLLDSNGVPVYTARGFFDKAILPGGATEIIIGDDFSFNGTFASIEVTIAPLL